MSKPAPANIAATIASVAIAVGIFLFFLLPLNMGFIVSGILAVAAYIGSVILFGLHKGQKEKDIEVELGRQGITPEMVQQAIAEGRRKTREIDAIGAKVKSTSVKKKIEAITDVCERIFQDFEKDPKDIKAARQFLQYYLDATIKILQRYSDLEEHADLSKDLSASLAKVESLLDTIHTAFEKQLAKLLEDDVMDLDVEMDLLEKTMKMNE
jgi:5-bromo-4-chloroindolyl phosphate hydrolysis protein